MIYSVENTIDIGKPVEAIYDADGNEIKGRNIRCDTETGEVIQHATDFNGNILFDGTETEILLNTLYFKPPLKVVFKEDTKS